ncbi:MAG: PEGA domain-containing protein [Polyangiaceae bacterium]
MKQRLSSPQRVARTRFAHLTWVLAPLALASMEGLAFAQPAPAAAPAAPAAAPGAVPPLSESLTGEAKASYEAGKVLFRDRDFGGSLVKFQAAYDKSKDARLKWNIAACEKNQRHYARVQRLIREYMTEGGDKLTAQDMEDARELLKTIEPFVVRLKLSVNQPGASVYVDDDLIGKSPIAEAIVVDIGQRKVRIVKDDYEEFSQTVVVGDSAEKVVDVKLVPRIREGKVIIKAPEGATIYVDGQPVGTTVYNASMSAGGHTVKVTQKGMVPYQSELVVEDKKTRSIDVQLQAEKGGVPTWVWVVSGGVVLAAGIGVGTYFLVKPNEVKTTGTFSSGFVDVQRAAIRF